MKGRGWRILVAATCAGIGLAALVAARPLHAEGPTFKSWVQTLEARGASVSAGLWDLSTGKLLESHQPDNALIPASTTKVISTYALLRTWKPDYTLQTEVYGDLRNGVVQGDLTLKGGGDPYLTSERLWDLAQELKAAGVQRVAGRIRLDQSAFDGQLYGNGWENTSADTTPPINALSVNFNRDDRGRITREPDRLAEDTVQRILAETGIPVEGKAGGGERGAKLLTFSSPPLRMLVQDINKFSNNFMVETLVKQFGQGTWPAGVRRIQDFYASNYGLGPDKIALTDGSGLSKENRLTARTLAIVLRGAYHDFEVGPEFMSSLKIIGGEPFHLHIKDPNLARRIRCKTGHVNGVWTVCGYLQPLHGEARRVFAILLNGADVTERDLWEQVSRWAN